jgi:2'-5' RNA ligase
VRLFVAVNPPEHLGDHLATRLDAVRGEIGVAWTRRQAWHLTLMFLGEWPDDRVEPLREALVRAVAPQAPLEIRPGGLGAFPDLRRPRVLFLQLDGGDPLRRLAGTVRGAVDATWPDGPQDHKAFRPHLTLARVKRPLAARDLARLRELDLGGAAPFTVAAAHLLASELRPEGARYTDLARLPLVGPDDG